MANSVFVPGHITGFFTIENHEITLKNGSCGVGFLLSRGVKTSISKADELTVDVNQGDSTVIDEVLSILEIDTNFKITQDIQLPIGAGFGTSAASALSLTLAINAVKIGGLMPTVMNAANEIAVERFLKDEISFIDIAHIISKTMDAFDNNGNELSINEILKADKWARNYCLNL